MTTPEPQNPQPGYTPPAQGGYPAAPAPEGYAAPAAYPAAAPATVPGRTLSIVGLILAFVAPLIGMILSLVAKSQLKKAGAPTGLATAGFWVGLALTIIGIVSAILMVVAFSAAFSMCDQLGSGVWDVNGTTYTCS